MKTSESLLNPQQGHAVWTRLWAELKPHLAAGRQFRVILRSIRRTLSQNDMFHGICARFAGAEWAGKPRSMTQWKALLVSGHAVATKLEVELVPGLEGEFINLRESTSEMGIDRASSLIEYALATATEMGLTVTPPHHDATRTTDDERN